MRRWALPYGLLLPGALWLVLFFVVPMYFMAEMALRSGSLAQGFTLTWEWGNFSEALSGKGAQISRTFLYSGVATLIALAIAYPFAYAVAIKASVYWRRILLFAVVAPLFATYLIRIVAWKTLLSDSSPIVDVLQAVALVPDDGRVLATSGAVIAGLTYSFLPFMILPIYASIEKLELPLIEAARDLYSSPRAAFLKVTLPLTAPGIVAGVLLTFIPTFGDYVNAALLGGTNQAMIGNRIQSLFLVERQYPEAAALSFLMMALILVIVLAYIRVSGFATLIGEREDAR
jgi:spermidine/putrescine transport system permease protein